METNGEGQGGATRRESAAGAVLEKVAERMGHVDARTVYGEAVERDGVTVIPVAKVRYGFGGGTGRKRAGGDEGTGGGAGVNVTPVGFIEIVHHRVRFRRIRPASAPLAGLGLALAAWFSVRLVGMALARR